MIDINQPVEKGQDMVLNNPDGTQILGSAEEFAKRKESGDLLGMHTDKAVPASEPVEKVETQEEDMDKPNKSKEQERLNDEKENRSAEDRTEGEVKQTERNREESKKESDQKSEDSAELDRPSNA